MLKRLTSVALAAMLTVGAVAVPVSDAEARSRVGLGIAAGVLAGTVLGAYAYGGPRYYSYASGPSCYRGPRQCDWAGRSCWFNRYGDQVCRGGEWRCWRRTVCD